MNLQSFTFNPFSENTYVLWDETMQCAIVDPGCYTHSEQQELQNFIENNELAPVLLLQTHAHIDHVFGTAFVCRTWGLKPLLHRNEKLVYDSATIVGMQYGVPITDLPKADYILEEEKNVSFGHSTLQVLFTPGHSPGSVCFFNEKDRVVLAGDVLFLGSIGRTDLPGGDYQTLINSIKTKLLPLGDEVTVYSGHGPKTKIVFEKLHNPFLNESRRYGE
jgi:glyoxylase-like metal-dependent hydrolase (beta-lactamase superfamily II)